MTILNVREIWNGRSGDINSKRERNYRRVFLVETSSPTVGMEVIRFAPALPRLWNPYVSAGGGIDLQSFCQNISGRQRPEDPYVWEVTADYTNRIDRPDINLPENPLLRPADIEFDDAPVMVVAQYDRNGDAIRNSAGFPFDPPLEIEEHRLAITITRNQAAYNALFYLSYYDSVNQDPFLGFQPGMVKCLKIKGKRAYENGIYYWPTTYQFQVRLRRDQDEAVADTWAYKVLDQGFYEKQGFDPVPTPITDPVFGRPVTSPWPLNGVGGSLGTGQDPVFLNFNLYRQKRFADLLLF